MQGGVGCTLLVSEGKNPSERCVLNAMPTGTPLKIALAKMGILISRGIVNGCACGCRGDFVLTVKGRDLVQTHQTN